MKEALAHAWSLHQAGERDAAERAYRALLAQDAADLDTLNCLGILLMQQHRIEEAFETFATAVESAPAQAAPYTNLARAALRLGRATIALQACDNAIARGAGAPGWLLRGASLRDLDRVVEARDALREGSALFPADAGLRQNLAVLELAAGDAAASARQLQALLTARPRDARSWILLGNARAALQDLDAAEQAYRHGLGLDGQVPEGWRLLGITQLQLGRHPAAMLSLQRAIQQQPRDQAALAALAEAASRCGDELGGTLLDFARLVVTSPLAVAATDGDFLGELAREILVQPSLRDDRLQKTTRDGGQSGNLSGVASPCLRRFETSLRAELQRRLERAAGVLEAMPHPLAGTAPQHWQLNLWATVLREQGRQEPHLHPSGWLSGVYYVALPQVGATREDGWIEFGTPPVELATPDSPRLRLQPQPGHLTTFPSYLYHRTLPHRGAEPRISLAFDVVPID